MARARETLISLTDTPYYHCMGRCVRRAFLCGVDNFSGKDYSHRKQWIVDKLAELSAVFLIDVCAYAVMSNHYHVVLKVNIEQSFDMTDEDVVDRWMELFAGNVLINRYIKGECHTQSEQDKAQEIIDEWRSRLSDISWFMRCLNESIARQANKEDNCTGRFWEGRFKSQALLNEQALLSCMAYVDLNPIRAGLTESVEESEFTSIEQRIREVESLEFEVQRSKEDKQRVELADFVGSQDKDGIPYLLMDYLELVDWTGRAILPEKKGYIPKKEPKILDKLGMTAEVWLKTMSLFTKSNYTFIGSDDQLKSVCQQSGKKWLAGSKECRQVYHN